MSTPGPPPRTLVIIDPQRIFADPRSEWGSPMWPDAVRVIRGLLGAARAGDPSRPPARAYAFDRVVVTRWIPPQPNARPGSWAGYMRAWPFADRPADDPVFELVDDLRDALPEDAVILDAPTFGKWDVLAPVLGEAAEFTLCGVSTDCCVISTALPAADAGATITVVTDACAGSTAANHAAALTVLGLYPPQIALKTSSS